MADGETAEVHTPFTTRAKELLELYNGLALPLLTVDERLDVLLHGACAVCVMCVMCVLCVLCVYCVCTVCVVCVCNALCRVSRVACCLSCGVCSWLGCRRSGLGRACAPDGIT